MKTQRIYLSDYNDPPFLVKSGSSFVYMDSFVVDSDGILLKLKSLGLRKNDILLSISLHLIRNIAFMDKYILATDQNENVTYDYSTNGTYGTHIVLELRKAYSNIINDEPIIKLKSDIPQTTLNFTNDSDNSSYLEINYIPYDDYLFSSKEISKEIDDETSFSFNVLNKNLFLSKDLFPNILPFKLSLNYSYLNEINMQPIFPDHWNLSILERVEYNQDDDEYILFDSFGNKHYFHKANFDSSDTYYDISGSGLILRKDLYTSNIHIYDDIFNEDTYKIFDYSDGYLVEIVLDSDRSITVTYLSNNSIIVEDYNDNKITVSSTNDGKIDITLYNSNYHYLISHNVYGFVSSIKYLNSQTQIDILTLTYDEDYVYDGLISYIYNNAGYALSLIYSDDKNISAFYLGTQDSSFHVKEEYRLVYEFLKTHVSNQQGVAYDYYFNSDGELINTIERENASSSLNYHRSLNIIHDDFYSSKNLCVPKATVIRDINGMVMQNPCLTSNYNDYNKCLYVYPSNYSYAFLFGRVLFKYTISTQDSVLPTFLNRDNLNGNFNGSSRGVRIKVEFYNNITHLDRLDINQKICFESSLVSGAVEILMPPYATRFVLFIFSEHLNGTINIDKAYFLTLKNVVQPVISYPNISNPEHTLDTLDWDEAYQISFFDEYLSQNDLLTNARLCNLGLNYVYSNNKKTLSKLASYQAINYKVLLLKNHRNDLTDPYIYLSIPDVKIGGYSYHESAEYLNYLSFSSTNHQIISFIFKQPLSEKNVETYDYKGKLISSYDVNRDIYKKNTYNSHDLLIKEETYNSLNATNKFQKEYEYDSKYRLSKEKSLFASFNTSITYTYLGNSLLIANKKINSNSYKDCYTYTDFKQLTQIKESYYTSSFYPGITLDSSYTNNKLDHFNIDNHKFYYSYDNHNLISGIAYGSPATSTNYLIRNDVTINTSGVFGTLYYKNGFYKYYTFDKYKRLTEIEDNNQTVVKYLYADLPFESNTFTNDTVSDNKISSHSKLGRIIDGYNEGERTSFSYNEYGLLTTKESKINNALQTRINIGYDDFNRTISLKQTFISTTRYLKYTYSYDGLTNDITDIDVGFLAAYEHVLISHLTFDSYKRVISKEVSNNSSPIIKESYEYAYSNNVLSTQIKKITYHHDLTYLGEDNISYNNEGNITSVAYSDGVDTFINDYYYDQYNRLVQEDDERNQLTTKYIYDDYGNITSIKYYNYESNNLLSSIPLLYDSTNKTKLISYNGKSITYDDNLNPLTYGNNVTFSYVRGRLLSTYNNSSTGIHVDYSYNHEGIRTKKIITSNSVVETHKYYLYEKQIVGEHIIKGSSNTYLSYIYDVSGIVGIIVNKSRYYFRKNIFGDVTHIYNSSGNLVNYYIYNNAFGQHTVYDSSGNIDNSDTSIGNLNPFRYRGYYFDRESNMYYCQSRYYFLLWRRWLNADTLDYLNNEASINLNLFAYCKNNPVMLKDESGHSVILTLLFLIGNAATFIIPSTVPSILPIAFNDALLGAGAFILWNSGACGGLSYEVKNIQSSDESKKIISIKNSWVIVSPVSKLVFLLLMRTNNDVKNTMNKSGRSFLSYFLEWEAHNLAVYAPLFVVFASESFTSIYLKILEHASTVDMESSKDWFNNMLSELLDN